MGYIGKLDSSGNWLWVDKFDGIKDQRGSRDNRLAIDQFSNMISAAAPPIGQTCSKVGSNSAELKLRLSWRRPLPQAGTHLGQVPCHL